MMKILDCRGLFLSESHGMYHLDISLKTEQDRQRTYNLILWHFRPTTVAVEKQ